MKYEEYKNSGMSWVGDVPINWQRKRIKFLCSNSSAGIWGEEEKGDVNDIVCFRVADFDYQRGYLCFEKLTFRNIQPKDLSGRTLTENSLLIEKSGGGEVTPVGRVVRYNFEDKATCSNFIHFITVNELHNRDFLYYYFYALYANKENLLYFNQTTGIQNLKVGEYLGQSIYLPSLVEQKAIATYLDEKCGEINRAIDVQKKKIDLLNELKQTIITDTVTKGLDPNAPMKDSGVEWIGEIPEHWEVMKLNFACKKITDFVASGSFADLRKNVTYLDEPDYAMLVRTADLSGKDKATAKVYVSKHSYKFLSNSNLFGGEVILPNIGASIGDVYIVPEHIYEKATLGPNSIMLISKTDNHFLYYLFRSKRWREALIILGQAAAQGKFNKTEVRGLKVIIPPITEQQAIVAHIEKKVSKIDLQITKANRRIELLEELKQSIITEAVTGKIKVC